jgi:hypothetical protein
VTHRSRVGVNGVRNFRQALASPYPVFTFTIPARPLHEVLMSRWPRLAAVVVVLVMSSACAFSLRNPRISDLKLNPGRYQNHSVSIDGVVTSAWGSSFSPFSFYKVDDGTGEVTVLSQGARRSPTRGAHVTVKGRVDELAVLGGESIGLHLREESLRVRR